MSAKTGTNKKQNIIVAAAATYLVKQSVILAVLFVVLVIYFVATFINLQSKVKAEELAVSELESSYSQQVKENEDLQAILENGDEEAYKEKIAREQGYALPEERVYYDVD